MLPAEALAAAALVQAQEPVALRGEVIDLSSAGHRARQGVRIAYVGDDGLHRIAVCLAQPREIPAHS